MNTNLKQGSKKDMFPSNVLSSEEISKVIDRAFLTGKPSKNERGTFNNHKTVKPLSLCEYLIALTTREGSLVLDPFSGSETTAVACKKLNRNFIAIEMNKEYVDISNQRLKSISSLPLNFARGNQSNLLKLI